MGVILNKSHPSVQSKYLNFYEISDMINKDYLETLNMDNSKFRSNKSIEDYLETILSLQNTIGQVRSIDIVREMNFSKPSVSVAMKNLVKKGTLPFRKKAI